MDLLKLLSANEIVAQVISFLLLFFLLRIFAWKRILGFLDQRKQRIISDFKKIDDTKAQIEQLSSEYKEKLSAIEETAKNKIREAVIEGNKITEEIRKKANQEAEGIVNNAKESIKYELSKAKEELKEVIVDLTIQSTENLIREKITGKDDKEIVKDFLNSVDKI